jgi:AFG3 family protein
MAAVSLYMYNSREDVTDEITIQEMMREYLMKGYVDKIQIINKSTAKVHLRGDAPGVSSQGGQRTLTIQLGTPEAFEQKLEHMQNELGLSPVDHVAIQYVNETDLWQELLPHLPSLLFLIPLLLAARAMSSGMGGPGGPTGPGGRNIFSIGKAFPAGQKDVKSKVKFHDVAGLDQAKKEVVEFVDFLKNPGKYEQLGARVPKGGLLVGPPGTGKTLLAKAVAGEADCPFYSMSGSDFSEMCVGVGPSRVRDLFQQARASAPSIIFIDEIDAVGRKRGKGGFSGGNDERENTLNQMLVEMDGFSSGTGVVVLAGTNRADVLDPALLRPGRFDRQIAIDKPDLNEREQIFKVHLKPVNLSTSLDSDSVARRMAALCPGFAGADIANICNEAAIFAARRSADAIEMQDFERACERVMGGLPKENSLMSKNERKTIALHECGHAIAGWFLEHSDPLLKVSIVPRSSGALGFAQYLPADISLFTKEAILDKIAVALGGRAAEELFVGKITTGASDDLNKVTQMAYSLVSVYGMNQEIGLLSYQQNNSGEQFYKPYSEETGQKIDNEARAIVEEQYERVKALLKEKTDLLKALAGKLEEKETLVYAELLEVLGERPYGIAEQYKSFVTASGNPFTAGIEEEKKADEGESPPKDSTTPDSGASSAGGPAQPAAA